LQIYSFLSSKKNIQNKISDKRESDVSLYKAGIEISRKVLADWAMNHPEAFKAVVVKTKIV
jgi:ribosomal protein L20